MLFILFKIEKSLPQFKGVKKPIFILGLGRSGTTIMGVVLSMHRKVGYLNEPKALWHAIYPYEDLIGSYSRGDARYRLNDSDVTPKVVRAGNRLFGSYLAASFSSRVVDKYPELIFRVPFVQAIFKDSKFIFLVRNGWDTCASIKGWSKRLGQKNGTETHDWWGANRRKWHLLLDQLVPEHTDLAPHVDAMRNWNKHSDMAAVEWILSMREGMKLIQKDPDNIMRVNYEDLCKRPREELQRISDFLDLEHDEVFYEYAAETLNPVPARPAIKLDVTIKSAFLKTMSDLGYHTENCCVH